MLLADLPPQMVEGARQGRLARWESSTVARCGGRIDSAAQSVDVRRTKHPRGPTCGRGEGGLRFGERAPAQQDRAQLAIGSPDGPVIETDRTRPGGSGRREHRRRLIETPNAGVEHAHLIRRHRRRRILCAQHAPPRVEHIGQKALGSVPFRLAEISLRKVGHHVERVRMLRAKALSASTQRLVEEWLGVAVAPVLEIDIAKVVHAQQRVGMIAAKHAAPDTERLLVQSLGS